MTLSTALCRNEACKLGRDGGRALFVPSRAWQLCCSKQCRMAVAYQRRAKGLELLKREEVK